MTSFLLDIWHDLREKRLWPVAVGLLAAAAAIPLVLLKPASGGTEQPTVVAKAPQPNTLPAVSVDSSPTHGSRLGTFSQRNPFKPMADLKKADAAGNPAAPSSTSPSAPATAASASSPSASAAGSSSSSPSSSSPGGASSTGGGAGGGGSSTPSLSPSPSPSPSAPATPTTKWFRYTADIRFGAAGSLKTLKGVTDFTLLPDDKTAAIVFMGVSSDAKSAIFFVADPAFIPAGEGKCNDKSNCRFVSLSLDKTSDQENFKSLDGKVEYDLQLVKLNREYISQNQAQGDTSNKPAPKLGKDAGGSTISQANDAVLPRLLDLSAVARESK